MTDRSSVRQALAALLASDVPSAQAVYAFQQVGFGGQTPIIAVTSSGSRREPLTLRGSSAVFLLDVHVFVLHRDDASGWGAQQAEDQLDQIESEIAAVVDANRKTADWQRLIYAEASNAREIITLEGWSYLHEAIPVEVLT